MQREKKKKKKDSFFFFFLLFKVLLVSLGFRYYFIAWEGLEGGPYKASQRRSKECVIRETTFDMIKAPYIG